jgi:NAD(P)-dependent dehydrogenase (short-subunit alcohol dehydrogenase family)
MSNHSTWNRYGQSKLANILHVKELAVRFPNITCVALHPGVVHTGISKGVEETFPWMKCLRFVNVFLKCPEQGAMTQLFAATGKNVKSGAYYIPVAKEDMASDHARDEKLARVLWEWTEKELDTAGY